MALCSLYRDTNPKILGLIITDIIYFIWRDRESIGSIALFRDVLHHSNYPFHDIINESKIALAVAVVENLYRIALYEFIGKTEICHIGTTGRTIDGEEAETGGWYVVEFAVGMCHQLVALLGGGIEANRIIHLIVSRIRDFLIVTINT